MTQLPSEAASDTHTYKYRSWVFLLNIFTLVFFGVIAVIPVAAFTTIMSSSFQADEGILYYSMLCAFAPFFAFFAFTFLLQIVTIFQIFFSYLRTTPERIEVKMWPYRHIQVRWSEVDRLGKFFLYDALYLQSYEVIGTSLSFQWPLKYFNLFPPSIALSSFNGWPNGPLAADLKQYAPRLFDLQPRAETLKTSNANASGISQDHRTQAALAHAAVLFTGIGLLVPLAIYYTQKKRSPYLAFHALQAFFYQLLVTILGLLFPFCLVGTILLPVLGISFSENVNTAGASLAAMMIITGVVTTLFIVSAFVFTIYGVVGAVRAYQGKEFRYAIIGKRIERRI